MFKWEEDQVAVLGVCVEPPAKTGRFVAVDYHQAPAAHRAIELLRRFTFDFVLVGNHCVDVSTWTFLRQMRTAYPYQSWAMVGSNLTEQQSQAARMFGASTIFDTAPSTNELLHLISRQRQQAAENVVNGRFDQPVRTAMRLSA